MHPRHAAQTPRPLPTPLLPAALPPARYVNTRAYATSPYGLPGAVHIVRRASDGGGDGLPLAECGEVVTALCTPPRPADARPPCPSCSRRAGLS
jgi:hypothetical protein